MNKKTLIAVAIFSIILGGCTKMPAKTIPAKTQVPEPTITLDLCTTYVNDVIKIATKLDEDMIKVEADVKNNEMNKLSWDLSQILNFTKSKVEALKPPSQYESFNQTFLEEITAYEEGASAYLMANPTTGEVKFQSGKTTGKTRKEALLKLACK